MNLQIFKADEKYKRYFSEVVLKNGAAYVVSSSSAVSGFFSFTFVSSHQAEMSFPFCLDKKAISLALETFLNDYPHIDEIRSLSHQKLEDLGFCQQIYKRECH